MPKLGWRKLIPGWRDNRGARGNWDGSVGRNDHRKESLARTKKQFEEDSETWQEAEPESEADVRERIEGSYNEPLVVTPDDITARIDLQYADGTVDLRDEFGEYLGRFSLSELTWLDDIQE